MPNCIFARLDFHRSLKFSGSISGVSAGPFPKTAAGNRAYILASINQVSKHSQELTPPLESEVELLLISQLEYYYDIFLEALQ